MSGFIYLWYDRKHKRFYLGKHWGEETDSYICSSNWMKAAQKRRPSDFKRRILQIVYDRKVLNEAEYKWGLLIKKEELRKRYYNLVPPGGKQWHDDPIARFTIGQKISAALNRPEVKKKRSESQKGRIFSFEHRAKLSKAKRGKPSHRKGAKNSEESKRKVSETKRGNSPAWNKGITWNEETREKIRSKLIGVKPPRVICPHCKKEGGLPIMKRFHFDNCKYIMA